MKKLTKCIGDVKVKGKDNKPVVERMHIYAVAVSEEKALEEIRLFADNVELVVEEQKSLSKYWP